MSTSRRRRLRFVAGIFRFPAPFLSGRIEGHAFVVLLDQDRVEDVLFRFPAVKQQVKDGDPKCRSGLGAFKLSTT